MKEEPWGAYAQVVGDDVPSGREMELTMTTEERFSFND